ncbi:MULTISPECIES: tRNA (uridine(34)/cytosine(34)/5-carboxymethylaminomethyluridine(34)-2'-O)-methyltransferase TrmL [Nitrosomonas]|uniref:tRNA (cytidine(34)-2'-O)-methyltransferase n=1 Tax=Nitrosomonas communis TaxID=44574 RepID=A0A0F7KF15_9PROT|nr:MULTISPECIES: tRNA (uridine(34)/cytosine(34)/5-carboxymethylaminomethyluridine(34)-2'-O)-methyltransferase TrmL [Nitrosomonas]AKH37417.1 rRNA methylase [Nitrosomonas communis]TYP91397.1 tRNA (cytidine/uridine-2'-O-)-methyltransferase [Nitrosomonas communis]UVS62643.1 tRNA (uridine(34)/cytosine(34)/5-carboxymethylaminomethyluridine(34)-2'-O)-methyltransferase TrmL [Nitrosomonas sp. PLL12]
MLNVILYQPEIPPNTGNIIRLCANTGATLHLIKPLGFLLNDRQLLRAGLDYHEFAHVVLHKGWEECMHSLPGRRIFAVSTKGTQRYDQVKYHPEDVFLFGTETRGLPIEILESFSNTQRIHIPMLPDRRSLNLANAVSIVIYEAWRQLGFIANGKC